MQEFIEVEAPEVIKKSVLQRRVERLIKKAEKKRYDFSSMDLSMFDALSRENWDEDKVNWLMLQHFERLYDRIYK